jgi:hypothetical protein
MLEQSISITIEAPLDHVHDATCALDWFGSELAVRKLAGGGQIGGTYELRAHALGHEHRAVIAVESTGPGRVEFTSVDCRECSFGGAYLLTAAGSGTHVTLHMHARPHGRYRFMKPVIGPLMQHSMNELLGRLKLHVEARPARAA